MEVSQLILRFLVLLALMASSSFGVNPCDAWFKKSKLKPGPDCLTKCTALATGMDTFACPQQCPLFCREQSVGEKILGRVAYYPGLTKEERKLIARYPKEAFAAFLAKAKAESATSRSFGRDDNGDESDAFRHFVWAGLLSKELGPELAKKFLDAHESDQKDDSSDKAMDLANNRAGLLIAEQLRKSQKLNQAQLEKEAIAALRNHTLIVLTPKGGLK